MKIKKLEINSFGKFNNFELKLCEGMQIIYGPNEYGKSTIMEFIKLMLYSRRGKETTCKEDKLLRSNYTPWNESKTMQGSLEFSHNGYEYTLQKKFDKASPLKDNILLYNKSLGEIVKLGKKEEIGEYFFKMDLKSFERSGFIGNIGKSEFEETKVESDSLSEKLLNLSLTGDMNFSVNKATSRINEAIKDLKPLKGKKGKIPFIESKIIHLHESIYNLKNFEREQLNILEKIDKIERLREEKQNLENKLELIETQRKISLIQDIIYLLKSKENYVNKIEIIGIKYSELENIIKNLNLAKNEIDLQNYKLKEIKKLTSSQDKELFCISDEDIEELNYKLELKKPLENKINKIRIFLNFELENLEKLLDEDYLNSYLRSSKKDILKNFLEKYINHKNNLKKLQKIKTELKTFETSNELEIKKELLENKLSEKQRFHIKKKYFFSLLQIVNIIMLFLTYISQYPYSYLHYSIIITIFCVLSGYGILDTIKSKNDISFLKEEIKKLVFKLEKSKKLESEILNVSENIENFKKQINNLFIEELNYLNNKLDNLNKDINDLLERKEAKSVLDYYKKYTEYKHFFQNQIVFKTLNKECENLKAKFISQISAYIKVTTYFEALDIFNELTSIEKKINEINEKYIYQSNLLGIKNSTLKELENSLENLKISMKNKNSLILEESAQDLQEKLDHLKELKLEETYIEINKNIKSPEKNLKELTDELEFKKQELAKMENYLKSLELAKKWIEESSNEIRKNFSPLLNKEASEIFRSLTGGKYSKIYVQKNYKILVEHESMNRNCDNLSSGTIDQAYLALRIAISKLLSEANSIPLILDDVLVRYDNQRLKYALDFLKEYSKNSQVIIFSCHRSIAKYAYKLNIPVIY